MITGIIVITILLIFLAILTLFIYLEEHEIIAPLLIIMVGMIIILQALLVWQLETLK
jgi:hypothetical protein